MSIRFVSVAVLLLGAYLVFGGVLTQAQTAGTDGFVDGVVTSVGGFIRGVADTVGRALSWG